MNRLFLERLIGQDNGIYAWIADVWPMTEDFQCQPTGTVVTGPHEAPGHLLARLRAGEGLAYRVLDDDEILYWEGRILIERETPEQEARFRPLYDLGEAYGCTRIQYQVADHSGTRWETL